MLGAAVSCAFVLGGAAGCQVLRLIEFRNPFAKSTPPISYEDYSAEEHYDFGVAYGSEDRLAWAIVEFERALRKDTEGRIATKACLALGNVYRRNGDLAASVRSRSDCWNRAEDWYAECLKRDPGQASAAINLADLCAERGHRLDEAAAWCRQAMDADPSLRRYALDALAWARFKQRRHEEAERHVREALSLTPAAERDLMARQYYHLGMILLATERDEEAGAAFEKAAHSAEDPVLKRSISQAAGGLRQ